MMTDRDQTSPQSPVYHVHVENLNVDGLNANVVNVGNYIQQQHITQTNITRSTIHRLTLRGEGSTEDDKAEGINRRDEGRFFFPATSTTEDSEDWTKLSATVFMFNKQALRPSTEVYRGKQHHASGRIRDIVVKLLKETEHCAREVDILLKLSDHPNIVKLYESGKCKGTVPQIFIAMELCRHNLNEYINENCFYLPKAVSFFQQTVSAIVFIHSNNIAHRDLKPSNILISIDGKNIKVSDFGISREISGCRTQVTVTHSGAGTEGFKAPETYLGKPEVGYKVDVFSLGICGCIIMTHGKHPFGPNSYQWTANIVANKNCDLSQFPKFPRTEHRRSQLTALIKRMLKPNPKERITSQEVREDAFFTDTATKEIEDVDLEKATEKSSKLLPDLKLLEELLLRLPDSKVTDRIKILLQIVERDICSKSFTAKGSIQRLKSIIPKSHSADTTMSMARHLTEEGHFLRALILFRISNELHQSRNVFVFPNSAAKWIGDLVNDVGHVSQLLVKSGRDTENAAIEFGLNYMEELLCDLRSLEGVSNDVRALNEARCLLSLSLMNYEMREYQNAIRVAEQGLVCFQKQFGKDATSYKYYSWLLLLVGFAHFHCEMFRGAERYYVRALEALGTAKYESEAAKEEDMNVTVGCLKFVRSKFAM